MSTINEQNIKDKITDNIKKYLAALKKAAALEQKNIDTKAQADAGALSGMVKVEINVPANVGPGDTFQFLAPSGLLVEVVVPPNLKAGDKFTAMVPSASTEQVKAQAKKIQAQAKKIQAQAKERVELAKKEDMGECSIQHIPSSLTIPERVIKEMKSKNVSACLVRYNNIWFSPARMFGEELNKGFVNEEKKETKEKISFNSADYINLSEQHPELEETSEIKAKNRPDTMVGRFFERRGRGAQKLAKSVGKGASYAGKKIMASTPTSRAVLTLGMVGEDSKPPEAYDFGDTKEIKININDVDHGEFPIKPFRQAWDDMSDIKSDKVIQVNWTNTTGEEIKTVDGGYRNVGPFIDRQNKKPGDTFEFKASDTSKVMTIVVPDDYTSGSELKVKIPDNNDNIVLIHPVYLFLISLKNPYKKPIPPGHTVRLYLRGSINDINSTISAEKPNFILLNNQVSANIAQIVFDEEESESFSIEEIRHNLAYYMYEIIHKKQLISLYDIYSALSKNLKPEEKKSRKIFAEHEQFAILKKEDNKSIKRRIFYRKDITPLKDDIEYINRNLKNIYIYVFHSESVFPGKNICLNKKYGVINVNGKFWELDKVKKTKEYDDLKNESDLNEACNLTFSGEKSNIYVMSLQELIRREKHPMDKALHGEIAAAKANTNPVGPGANPAAVPGAGGTHAAAGGTHGAAGGTHGAAGGTHGAAGGTHGGVGPGAGVAATLKNRLAIALAIAIKNNIEHMKKRGQETAEVFFRKLLEELKKAINSKKGGGKQKKKIQKGGKQNSTRLVEEILKDIALYINNNPDTISVLNGMVEISDSNVKNAIKGNTELMNKLYLKEPVALTPKPEEPHTKTLQDYEREYRDAEQEFKNNKTKIDEMQEKSSKLYFVNGTKMDEAEKANDNIINFINDVGQPSEIRMGEAKLALDNFKKKQALEKHDSELEEKRFAKLEKEKEKLANEADEKAKETQPAQQPVQTQKPEPAPKPRPKPEPAPAAAQETPAPEISENIQNKLKEKVRKAKEKLRKAKMVENNDFDKAETDGVSMDKLDDDERNIKAAEKELEAAEKELKAAVKIQARVRGIQQRKKTENLVNELIEKEIEIPGLVD